MRRNPGFSRFSARIHQCKRGFTLAELLVVVAILSLMTALLLPALGRVRDVSKIVSCVGNLSQIGQGVSMYATDNDGWLPPRQIARAGLPLGWQGPSGYAAQGLGWASALSSDPPILGKYTQNTRVRDGDTLFVDGRVPERSVWRCPSDQRDADGVSKPSSYAASPMMGEVPTPIATSSGQRPQIRQSEVIRSEVELAFVDARWRLFEPGYGQGFGATDLPFFGVLDREQLTAPYTIGAPGSLYSWSKRHKKGMANVLFFDGHVDEFASLYNAQIDGVLRVSLNGWRTPIVRID